MTDLLLSQIKEKLGKIDPVSFCEQYLTLEDGRLFRLHGSGYKPFVDLYRYLGVKAIEPGGKHVVLLKGRQVAGTTLITNLVLYFLTSGLFGTNTMPSVRILHLWPDLARAYAYTKTKLNPTMQLSKPVTGLKSKNGSNISYVESMLDASSPTNNSLQFKQFVGGNHLFIDSVGINANRLRGRTGDIIFFDEVQDMSSTAIANSKKILTKAHYGTPGEGVVLYTGTPTFKGSTYYDLWNRSSQQYYYLGCEKCGEHFPLYTPNSNEWEKIWLYEFVVRCSHCGFEQDKRKAAENGKWISTRDPADSEYIGFHLNQLFIPDFTKEKIISEKPENSATNTEKTYQNEVLGEFYQGEVSTITPEQLIDKCGDTERRMSKFLPASDTILSFLGVDIGAKSDYEQMADSNKNQGQSYSVGVILTVSNGGVLSIESTLKFKKNDLESKKSHISKLMREYNCKLGVCDIGFAHDLNEILQREYGDKFLASQASNHVNNKIKYNDDLFPKVIVFEKDFWIHELYERLKQGHIRFPLGDYEMIAWFIQHCTNYEIKPTISRTGEVNPRYVKGGHVDGFSALMNAYIAYKFFVTDGFTNHGGGIIKDKINNKPFVTTAYMPRR